MSRFFLLGHRGTQVQDTGARHRCFCQRGQVVEEGGAGVGARTCTSVGCQVLGVRVVVCATCHGSFVSRYKATGQCPYRLTYSERAQAQLSMVGVVNFSNPRKCSDVLDLDLIHS
ncbi:hypothetical protein TIFTF001_021418 [Ficus carica]|uniref:Uncharacterized protein n=1 Tax=Ficus carica TaxID=3494 RepID=A0AA88DJT0_FICCA|nr:hypothetical protein TIFTF001_021418 [Ficus carica]